jgi:MFS family permease
MRTFESLALPNFRLLWLGQLTTGMGLWMDQVTRTWLIYSLTQSPLQLGIVSAVRGIPLLIFGSLAGAVADRYGRKYQLVLSQVTNALLNITLATLVLTGQVQPWLFGGNCAGFPDTSPTGAYQ